jgi:hypothetical protein
MLKALTATIRLSTACAKLISVGLKIMDSIKKDQSPFNDRPQGPRRPWVAPVLTHERVRNETGHFPKSADSSEPNTYQGPIS